MERRISPAAVIKDRRVRAPAVQCSASASRGFGDLGFPEDEDSAPSASTSIRAPVRELPADDGLGQRILDVLLDRPAKLPGSVGRIEPLLDQEIDGRLGVGSSSDALLGELRVDARRS